MCTPIHVPILWCTIQILYAIYSYTLNLKVNSQIFVDITKSIASRSNMRYEPQKLLKWIEIMAFDLPTNLL